jgi:hypothetical protein
MKICIIILTDGRNDYLAKTLESLESNVVFPEDAEVYKIMVDDWPADRDLKTLKKLAKKYGIDKLVLNEENTGIDKTVQKAWSLVPDNTDYIWHQENDFEYLQKVDVSQMISVLNNPTIVQVALVRQPWFEDEKDAGSLLKTRPVRFRQASVSNIDVVIHRDHFTHNPSIYKAKWIEQLEGYTEYKFKDHLLAKNGVLYFSYLGKLEDSHTILHIGERKR